MTLYIYTLYIYYIYILYIYVYIVMCILAHLEPGAVEGELGAGGGAEGEEAADVVAGGVGNEDAVLHRLDCASHLYIYITLYYIILYII